MNDLILLAILTVAWLALFYLMAAAWRSMQRMIDGTLGRAQDEGPTAGPWSPK